MCSSDLISTLPHLSYKVTLHRQQHNTHITTHHHPLHTIYLSLIFNILKLHHLAAQRHISISFFISHTKPPFLESNITHGITQKTASAATIISSIYYILLSYHLSYTSIHITNTISHNIYIYIYIYIS